MYGIQNSVNDLTFFMKNNSNMLANTTLGGLSHPHSVIMKLTRKGNTSTFELETIEMAEVFIMRHFFFKFRSEYYFDTIM